MYPLDTPPPMSNFPFSDPPDISLLRVLVLFSLSRVLFPPGSTKLRCFVILLKYCLLSPASLHALLKSLLKSHASLGQDPCASSVLSLGRSAHYSLDTILIALVYCLLPVQCEAHLLHLPHGDYTASIS